MTSQPDSERGRKKHSRKRPPAASETKPTEQGTSLGSGSGPAQGTSCGPPLVSLEALLKLADFVEDYKRRHGIPMSPQQDPSTPSSERPDHQD
jgi:hypothetical protein